MLPQSRWPQWALTAAVTVVSAAALWSPVLYAPLETPLGALQSEAPGHLWTLWAASEGLLSHGPLVVADSINIPEGFHRHLMDPVNLLAFVPLWLLGGQGMAGAVLGWNGLHVAWTLVGGWGMWHLTRRLLPQEPPQVAALAAAVGTATLLSNSMLVGQPYTGRTEYLAALLYPLHLALLHRWLSEEDAPRRVGIAAGVTLGLGALGGWYLAVFMALAEIPLAAWMCGRSLLRRAPRLLVVAGIAVLMLVPAAWALAVSPPPGLGQSSNVATASYPLGAHFRMMDVREEVLTLDQPLYLGLMPLLLGLVGAVRWPRRGAGWLLVTLGLGVLGLGTELFLFSLRSAVTMPAAWLTALLPPLSHLHTWSRIGFLAAVPLAAGATLGAAALLSLLAAHPRQRGALGLLLVVLVAGDQWTWPRESAWQRPTFDPAPPPGMLTASQHLPPGGLLVLPLVAPLPGVSKRHQPMRLLWHLSHGRPVTSTANIEPSIVHRSWIASAVANVQIGRTWPTGESSHRCAIADLSVLEGLGIVAIVEDGQDPSSSTQVRAWLVEMLGAPHQQVGDVAAWALPLLYDSSGTACQPLALPWRSDQK